MARTIHNVRREGECKSGQFLKFHLALVIIDRQIRRLKVQYASNKGRQVLIRYNLSFSVAAKIATIRSFALLLILGSSGCAIFDPHIFPNAPEIPDGTFHGTLPGAIDRASTLREQYFRAVRQHSIVRSSIGVSLIPLSASALYLGFASSANAELASGIGLGAAGLYGLGNYLESNPRQRAYLNGAQALTCAVVAMGPLLYKEDEYVELSSAISTLPDDISLVNQQISKVQDLLNLPVEEGEDPIADKLLRSQASGRIKQAEQTVKDAESILEAGYLLKGRINVSGTALDGAIHAIAISVSREVLKTEPELASVMGIAASLGQWAGIFGSVTTIKPAPEDIPVEEGERLETGVPEKRDVQEAINTLANRSKTLAEAALVVSINVRSSATIAETSGSLESCTVDPIDTGLEVLPEGDEFSLNAGDSIAFSITDDVGIPRSKMSGPVDPGVSLSIDATGGFIVATIAATKEAKTSDHFLHIVGANGTSDKKVKISVTKKEENSKREDGEVESKKKCSDPEGWKSFLMAGENEIFANQEAVTAFQKGLQAELEKKMVHGADGCLGTESRNQIVSYKVQNKDALGIGDDAPVTSNVNGNLYKEIVENNDATILDNFGHKLED